MTQASANDPPGSPRGLGANQGASQSAGQSASQSAGQSAGQGAGQSAGQSAGQGAGQSAGQSAGQGAGQSVSVEKLIAAPPGTIFALLCDPAMHPLIDGSGTVREPVASQSRLALGSTFGMKMRMGLAYRVKNRVVECETDRLIAWQTNFGQTWRYELTPVVVPAAVPVASTPGAQMPDAQTLVRETFDWSTAKWPRGIELARFHRRNVAAMAASLERLAALATEQS